MEVETYCGLALSGQRSGRYPGMCVQAVGSGLRGQRLRARDESALEVAPPDRRLDRRSTAFTTMRYTNRQPLPFTFTFDNDRPAVIGLDKLLPALELYRITLQLLITFLPRDALVHSAVMRLLSSVCLSVCLSICL